MGSELISSKQTSALVARTWSTEQDGFYDRPIEVWYNNNWVPAYFKDIQAGDFFLILDQQLDPSKCFYATTDVQKSVYKGVASFTVKGLEVVQRPSIDINLREINGPSNDHQLRLEGDSLRLPLQRDI